MNLNYLKTRDKAARGRTRYCICQTFRASPGKHIRENNEYLASFRNLQKKFLVHET